MESDKRHDRKFTGDYCIASDVIFTENKNYNENDSRARQVNNVRTSDKPLIKHHNSQENQSDFCIGLTKEKLK